MTTSKTPGMAWWILLVLGLIFALFAGDCEVLGILKKTLSTKLGRDLNGYLLFKE